MQVPKREYKDAHSITIPPELWKFAKQVGRGNASAGITFVLERAKTEAENNQEPSRQSADSLLPLL